MIGTTFSTPSSDARWFWSITPSSPMAPMTVRNWPRERWALEPMRSISETTRSIDACGALVFITTIKTKPPTMRHAGEGSRRDEDHPGRVR
jgi:hypothetical protein